MHITLLCIGKTDEPYLRDGLAIYIKRLSYYTSFELTEIADSKKWNALPPDLQKAREGEAIMQYMNKHDFCVLLDEKGKTFTSVAFSGFLQQQMNKGLKKLLFVIGGPWGFSGEVCNRAHMMLSLSKMTFSHQMVRLFFTEQLYRAFTILRNESYHNE